MKELFLVFAILLLLLTLISAFGGSIKYTERFEEEEEKPSPPQKEVKPDTDDDAKQVEEKFAVQDEDEDKIPTYEAFDGEVYAAAPGPDDDDGPKPF
jgi:hypothetical protein